MSGVGDLGARGKAGPARKYVAKQRIDGLWGVYDTEKEVWPALRPDGTYVPQAHMSEETATREAFRLEATRDAGEPLEAKQTE